MGIALTAILAACGGKQAEPTPIQWKTPNALGNPQSADAAIGITQRTLQPRPQIETLGPNLSSVETSVPIAIIGWPAQLGPADVQRAFDLADVPQDYRADLNAIVECESHWQPGAIGDSGNSLGAAQLWSGWFQDGEDPFDVVTNLRVAVRVREIRGRWGGGGGWSCADRLGIG